MEHLYDAALQKSSQRTYQTGQRAYLRFAAEIVGDRPLKLHYLQPFTQRPLSKTELSLAFFIAYLVLHPTITSPATILGYTTHVKYKFRENGCDPAEYKTPFLGQIRKGVENVFPQQADSRRALLLPRYLDREAFTTVDTREASLARFATILGFVGMLRPHTFATLKSASFVLVDGRGQTVQEKSDSSFKALLGSWKTEAILGFYIEFHSKTMRHARAYFPNLSHPNTPFAAMCPVRALKAIAAKNYIKKRFLQTQSWTTKIVIFLQRLLACSHKVPLYALRIGGRTWYITKGLDRQFVDYLGTWKSPESSARYYREAPAAVLKKVQQFYIGQQEPPFS